MESAFPKGTLPIHQSIQYTDFSLKEFFKSASSQPWYNNTLFVITADHTALSEKPFYQNRVGMYSIPVIYFCPDGSLKGNSLRTTQQIDILPSVLDFLHYDKPFFAFGTSVFDSVASGTAVNFINDSYQLIRDDFTLVLDTISENKLFKFTTDSTLQKNVFTENQTSAVAMENHLKAIIQQFNHTMLMNKMGTPEYAK